MSKSVVIYTDGACTGNPGPGGWGAVLMYGAKKKEISGGEWATTNNRMELLAVIKALQQLQENCSVELFTDSEYVRKGASMWIHKWKQNNWKLSTKNSVLNKDLWVQVDQLSQKHRIKWKRVAAHSGDEWNEYVDGLAKSAIPGKKHRNNERKLH